MQCPLCRSVNQEGANFCWNCGQPLRRAADSKIIPQPSGIVCPACRLQNRLGARFCENCGTPLVTYIPPASSPPIPVQAKPRRGCKTAAIVIGILVGVCIILGGAWVLYMMSIGQLTFQPLPSQSNDPILPQVVFITATQDLTILPTDPAVVSPPEANVAPPTYTPPATYTITPTATLKPPAFITNQSAYCRSGPSMDYGVITSMQNGNSALILGKSPQIYGLWWQVNWMGVKCWVWSELGAAEGDLASVPEVSPPLLPTLTYTPTSVPTLTPTPTRDRYPLGLTNQTGKDLCQLYVKPQSSTYWGSNYLYPGSPYGELWPNGGYIILDLRTSERVDIYVHACGAFSTWDRYYYGIAVPFPDFHLTPP